MLDKKKKKFENDSSFLYGPNSSYIEKLYTRYKNNSTDIDNSWHDFFNNIDDSVFEIERKPSWYSSELKNTTEIDLTDTEINTKIDNFLLKSDTADTPDNKSSTIDSIRALMMIRAYRMRGHLIANLDPLVQQKKDPHPELDPRNYGFEDSDMDRKIYIDNVLGLEYASINEMLEILKRTYCSTLGVEFLHIADPEQKAWIQERIEGVDKEITFTEQGKKAILTKLIEAEGFEKFCARKYTGTKRFGLDGAESMIPALEQIIKRGGNLGLTDIVIGMPHRGRLNVLANVMQKPMVAIFNEFQGGSANPADVEGSGDVKYHLGASADREFDDNAVHLSLTANPSHLEAVDPVVLGKVRAKQDEMGDEKRVKVLPLLIHGDASFAGQGIVSECLGLSGLKGHKTGGSIHFIVNNQIGFTTSPTYARSSPYPSDVAKMVDAPIFHVNGDDPEAVVYAAKVGTEFRQKFNKPFVIDMICYRRFGHNEGDEPLFTQPLMYKKIKNHTTTMNIYADKLISEGVIDKEFFDDAKKEFKSIMDGDFAKASSFKPNKADWLDGAWKGLSVPDNGERKGVTGISEAKLQEISNILYKIPTDFEIHKTLSRVLSERHETIKNGKSIDWATAEALAFGSLIDEGISVRLSGQDSERGTFSQRHSVLHDQHTEDRYIPLNAIHEESAQFEVINSMLSEEAVLGFEYGYSLARPSTLTLWEAQFGDFANGAQVIIDQFICSGEAKWLRMCGLVLLLPHGYEGQGPEHSSARLERFLQLCAEDNIQVANCTTPANYFHILRRQIHRNFRKPLVIMTPKSLLRNKNAVSDLNEFNIGETFHRLLWDDKHEELINKNKSMKLVLCSGRIYYDLLEERENQKNSDVYLLRVEQLYPFPEKGLIKELTRHKDVKEIIWCQEEPKNMGAWVYMKENVEELLERLEIKEKRIKYIGRAASASTATGLMGNHKAQLSDIFKKVFGVNKG